MRFIILVVLSIFFVACSNEAIQPLSIGKDVSVNAPPPFNSVYKISSIISGNDGEIEIFAGYNEAAHSIDVFEFSSERRSQIKLEEEGPDAIQKIRYIQCISPDSILLATGNEILMIDSLGTLLFEYDILRNWKKDAGDKLKEYYEPYFVGDNGVQAHFNKYSGDFYCRLNYFKNPDYISPENYLENVVMFVSINLFSREVTPLGIKYPEKLRVNSYGYLSKIYCDFTDGGVFYEVSGFPEIYYYDLASRKLVTFGVHEGAVLPTPFLVGDDLLQHLKPHNFYADIRIDQKNNVLYRFISISNGKGKHNSFMQVYSLADFSLLKEGAVPRWRIRMGAIFNEKGIYLPILNGPENKLSFTLIN